MKILDDEIGAVKFEARTCFFRRLPARNYHSSSFTLRRSFLSGPEKDGWMMVKRGIKPTRDEEYIYTEYIQGVPQQKIFSVHSEVVFVSTFLIDLNSIASRICDIIRQELLHAKNYGLAELWIMDLGRRNK